MSNVVVIEPAAYLAMCECAEEGYVHGHITLADGSKGPAVLSRSEAFEMLELLRVTETVPEDEFKVLRDMIYDSELPSQTPAEVELEDSIVDGVAAQLTPEFDEVLYEQDDKEVVRSMFYDDRIVSNEKH